MPTIEKAPIDPRALRHQRREKDISQRELGRRIAARLGRAESASSLQVKLSRIENGDGISEEDRQLVDALAAELAVGAEDLAEPPLWIFAARAAGGLSFTVLALRLPAFTSPEAAYAARDQLAHATKGRAKPFQNAILIPFASRTVFGSLLDESYGGLGEAERNTLVEVDPDFDRMQYLVGTDVILHEEDLGENALEELTDMTIANDQHQPGELLMLHDVALRRLVTATPETPETQLAVWRREEERLFQMIQRSNVVREQWRNSLLSGGGEPGSG